MDPERASFGLECWRGPTRGMTAAHRHDDLEFNHADVDLEYVIDGRSRVIPAGTVAVFWAARPHQLVGGADEGEGTESWLTVPLRHALAWRLPAAFMRRMMAGDLVVIPADAAIGLDDRAVRWSNDLSDGELRRRIAELEIEAFALRLVDALDDALDTAGTLVGAELRRDHGAPRTAAAAMAALMSERSDEDLSVAAIAAHVHLHPQYAMSVFRAALGVTIGDYLTQCRVASAQQLLLTTDLAIPDVGFAAGFGSQSQFYDRFRRWCGETPAVYRRRLRAV